jgi:hypothetical protein
VAGDGGLTVGLEHKPAVPASVVKSCLDHMIAQYAQRWLTKTPGLARMICDAIDHSDTHSTTVYACGLRIHFTRRVP